MARVTPSIGTSGIFDLRAPFITIEDVTYTVNGIRTYEDIYRLNIDVFKKYYQPVGLTESDLEADIAAGALMITLMANEIGVELSPTAPNTIIYVPDTYINSFPTGDDVPYNHVILSASLGALPAYLDLSDVVTDVTEIISAKIGVEAPELKVNTNVAKLNGVMTTADHEDAEEARNIAITNRNTIYTRYYDLDLLYQQTLEQYQDLEEAYISLSQTNSEDREYLASQGYYTIDLENAATNQTIYVDANFFNKVKLVMDISSYPDNPYVEIDSAAVVNGTTASVDIAGNLIFDFTKISVTGVGASFNIDVKDENDFVLHQFTITLVYISLATPTTFTNATLSFDLTLPTPHRQRIYFNSHTRTERTLLDAPVINDPFDPDEPYYVLAGGSGGVTYLFGKNWIEFNVNESFYTGNFDTHVLVDFIKRGTSDIAATFDLHITNTI